MSQDEQYRERLYDFRNQLLAAQADQSAQFDKTLIALSGGALGLTLTLTSMLELKPGCLLVASWALFIFSLISTLFSFKASECQFRLDLKSVDKFLRGESEIVLADNNWAAIVLVLNATSGASFVLATAFFMVLVFSSLS